MTTASICTIGDEILIGQIVDTNSSKISRQLNSIGIRVTRMVSIGDDHDEIISNLANELRCNNIVIVTGGLGPTKDDITKAALAELSCAKGWHEDAGQLEMVRHFLSSRGLEMLDINRAQAYVPDTCKVIVNRKGTAANMAFHLDEATVLGNGTQLPHKAVLYSLPGVPYECEAAMPDVLEDIKQNFETSDIFHRTIMTYGIAESALSKKIEDWEDSLPADMHLAYLPNLLTGVRLRLSIYGGVRVEQEKRIEAELAKLRGLISEYIYSDQDDTLPQTIGRLLKAQGKKMSAAESCTGGTISKLMTATPGCSEYYWGSVTSYDNYVKIHVLGVPEEIIREHGAVSSECVAKMAEGVRRITGTDYAVATSGIAGPGGGTPDKPVGTVWMAVATEEGTLTRLFHYSNDRERNIERAAATALNLLRQVICGEISVK